MGIGKFITGTLAVLLLGAGVCLGQVSLGFTNLSGFPTVVTQGSQYNVNGWIINSGTASFTGIVSIELKPDSGTVITVDNNFNVSSPLLPGDSIFWSRTNYTFPSGHFRNSNNGVMIWPTASVGGDPVDSDTLGMIIYYSDGSAFRLSQAGFGVYSGGITLDQNYDLHTLAINLSDQKNTQDVCLYAQVEGRVPMCIMQKSGEYELNEEVDFDLIDLNIVDKFSLSATEKALVDQVAFYAMEVGDTDEALNKIIVPVQGFVGISPLQASSVLRAYPNPFDHQLTVQVPDDWKADAQIKLRDLSGRLVYQQAFASTTIELGTMAAGSYLLEIESHYGTYRQQVICR
jgi:hypothetical protein